MSGRKAGRREERWRKSWLEDEEEEEEEDDDADSGGREVPKGTTDGRGRTDGETDGRRRRKEWKEPTSLASSLLAHARGPRGGRSGAQGTCSLPLLLLFLTFRLGWQKLGLAQGRTDLRQCQIE